MKKFIVILIGMFFIAVVFSSALYSSADKEKYPDSPKLHFAVSSPGHYPGYVYGFGKDFKLYTNFTSNNIGELGTSFIFADDMDGDNQPELLAAAPFSYYGSYGSTPTESRVLLISSRSGNALWELFGNIGSGLVYGETVDMVDDMDGDGRREFLVVSTGEGFTRDGEIFIYSSGTKKLLLHLSGSGGDYFGKSVATTSDMDGDGINDLIVGSPAYNNFGGMATLFSSLHRKSPETFGIFKWSTSGAKVGESFGSSMAVFSDMNGDEGRDIIVGSPDYNGMYGVGAGRVSAVSGKNGIEIWMIEGNKSNSNFGSSLLVIDDVNNDDINEFIAGAVNYNGAAGSQAGMIYLYSGATRNLLWTKEGLSSFEHFGSALSLVDDLDGDGVDDFAVGAPDYSGNGRVDTYSSRNLEPMWSIYGSVTDSEFGSSVVSVGDIDGDKIADLIIGAPDDGNGRVDAYSGATQSLIWSAYGEDMNDNFGVSLAPLADINGDSYNEVLVGADMANTGTLVDAGKVYALSGADGSIVYTLDGNSSGAFFGRDISSFPGGLIGNNRLAFTVGAPYGTDPYNSKRGVAYAFTNNGTLIWHENGIANNIEFGGKVFSSHDLTGDDIEDVVISAPKDSRGTVSVYKGAIDSRLWTQLGDEETSLGSAVAVGGDVNGDGMDDIAISAQWNNPGRVIIYSGISGNIMMELEGIFGSDISFIRDVNGDGMDDIVIGDHLYNSARGIGTSGRVSVHSGDDGSLLWERIADGASYLGFSVSTVLDVNGDGVDEVLAGAPNYEHCGSSGCEGDIGRAYLLSGADGSLLWDQKGFGAGAHFGYDVRGVY